MMVVMSIKSVFLIGCILSSTTFVSALANPEDQISENVFETSLHINSYIKISAQEAWDLMHNSEDGRQIPIDMRRPEEYLNERIVPPNPEDWPRFFPYEWTSDGPGPIKNEGILLRLFILLYNEKEIIIYCRTGRRTGLAAQIIIDNGFQGTLYNMVDGITEWKAIGLPTTLD